MKTILLFLLLSIPIISFGATTWTGPSTITIAAWNTAANWSAGIPTASEQITFNTAVMVTENVPITSANPIKIQNTLTIKSGVTLSAANVSIEGGTLTNNGNFTANNLTYSNLGGTVNNNKILSLTNLNVGSGNTAAGTFNNNSGSTLSVVKDIVVEEGTFDNNPGGVVSSAGLDVQNGATVLNGGTFTSSGSTSTVQVTVADGGFFTNESSGSLTVDFSTSNVYAIKIQGGFTNNGGITVGHGPFNPGSQGILIGSSGDFVNTSLITFDIDPTNCVLQDNHGMSGSFSNTSHITINSGKNCLNSLLPIAVSSLTGRPELGYNALSWSIENEAELKECMLERSESGLANSKWNSLMKYSSTNLQAHNYSYQDYSMAPISYYRLKSTELDGTVSVSHTISINNHSYNKQLQVYPVPAHRVIHLKGQIPADISNIYIYNIAGVVLKTINLAANSTSGDIDIQALPDGVYYLMLADQYKAIKEKFKFVKIN